MLSDCWTVWEGAELSRNINVWVVVAAVVGVPVIAPVVVSNERLAGSAGETDHVYGSAPPEPLSEAEYGLFTSPSGSEVVVIDKLPGVGPLSPPQPVNPRT
jgi:hypothetical protein